MHLEVLRPFKNRANIGLACFLKWVQYKNRANSGLACILGWVRYKNSANCRKKISLETFYLLANQRVT